MKTLNFVEFSVVLFAFYLGRFLIFSKYNQKIIIINLQANLISGQKNYVYSATIIKKKNAVTVSEAVV